MLDERFGAMPLYSIRRLGSLMAPSAEKPVLQHPDCDADRRPPIFLRLPPFRSGAEAPRWRLLRVLFLRRCPLPAPSKTREPAATRCPVVHRARVLSGWLPHCRRRYGGLAWVGSSLVFGLLVQPVRELLALMESASRVQSAMQAMVPWT